ncbi:hypothetical protein [Bradyrhizobium elkanii]
MKRKKTDVVQLSKIRMREDLRLRLVNAAERRDATLNGEIVHRLEQSFGRDAEKQTMESQVEKDAQILNLMLAKNDASADVFRKLLHEMQLRPGWDTKKQTIREIADVLHRHIYNPEIFGEE